MNLFDVAAANGSLLGQQLDSIISGLAKIEAECLLRFAEHVKHGSRVSVNMRMTVLNSFLTFGRYLNMYELAGSLASKSTKSVDEILQAKLELFYERRIIFDKSFEQGEQFRYGALNIGGIGITRYGDGEFCIILKDHMFSTLWEVAYLRSDPLEIYFLPGPIIDEAAIRRDAAPHTQRHCLAAIKLASRIIGVPETQWAELLCSSSDYIEAIFIGDVTPDCLEEIRISKLDHDFLFYHAYEEFRGKLSDADRYRVHEFMMIREHMDGRGIALKVI